MRKPFTFTPVIIVILLNHFPKARQSRVLTTSHAGVIPSVVKEIR